VLVCTGEKEAINDGKRSHGNAEVGSSLTIRWSGRWLLFCLWGLIWFDAIDYYLRLIGLWFSV
jgi:hypothetical protein